ncbi:hypothetical protein SOM61_21785 [Massilia sp. CFBP9012]|uniref:hypothetical protein n=1 Tax=Massilia sp. CFBP9012 TaxID=3096531 RepID=UPI002A6A7A3B|nr:hypothetical protein [Massilia sp. CFBP9012]MDY0977600.1 hypothetical protein [Massilia sp. CFBP9012]
MAVNQASIMWQKFVQGLNSSSAGAGLDPKTLMPTGGLTNADWQYMDVTGLPAAAGTPPVPGTTLVSGLENWSNVMPAWSPSYAPSSMNFYDQYKAFLFAIALKGGNPALQQIADGYGVKVTNAQAALSAANTKCMTAWAAFSTAQSSLPPSAQSTYTQWYQANGWNQVITSAQNALAAQVTLYNQALAQVGGPDYQTISGAQAKVVLSPGSGNGITDPSGNLQPAYAITPGLNDWYVSALQTLASSAPPQISMNIKLDDSNSSNLVVSSFLDVSASGTYDAFFWGGSASTSYSQSSDAQDYTSLVQGMTMTYTAQAAQLFSVAPGAWFDSSIVADFYDQVSPTSALANKQLFGPDGILNLRAGKLLVVLKPSVTMTSDTQSIQALFSKMSQNSSASISIGGFCWSAQANMSQGASSFSQDVTMSSDKTSITITDNTNSPKVIAVVPITMGKSS